MIIHHVRVVTGPGLQAGTQHHLFVLAVSHAALPYSVALPRIAFRLHTTVMLRRCQSISVLVAVITGAVPALADAQSAAPTRYRVTSTAVLSLDRAPQSPLVDTVVTTTLITLTHSAGTDGSVTLSIDSLQQVSTGMVKRTSDAPAPTATVSALLIDGRPRITGDSATACASERPMAGLLPELMPLLPTPLRAEQQWSDTLTVTTCRAGLPVTIVTIAAYRTLTGMDSSTVLLERRGMLRASAAAMIRDQTVTLSGTGISESLGVVSIATRSLQSWRGTQSLDFELSNGQQTRRMVQQLTDSVTLVP